MKLLPYFLIAVLLIACKSNDVQLIAKAPTITLLSEIGDLSHAESVVYDPTYERLYVSVQGEQEPGDGGIATLDLNGNILNKEFTIGLDNPKGIAINGDRIYVSDVTKLIAIDRKSGDVLSTYSSGDEQFLNDVTIDDKGNVYVSDMRSSSLYRLDNSLNYTKWLSTPLLENPNGLLAIGNDLYVGAWGLPSPIEGQNTAGRFLKVDLDNQQITYITKAPQGNLDGVQEFNDKYFLISDWRAGMIYKGSKTGSFEPFFTSQFSVGDILYIKDLNLLALPLNRQNMVQIYSVE